MSAATAPRPAPPRPATRPPGAPPSPASRLQRAPARRAGPVYRGLPRPIRFGLWIVLVVAVGGVVGLTAPAVLRQLGLAAVLQPGVLPWYGVRALGFLAYLAFAGSVIYGLLLSTKLLDAFAHRPISIALHQDLALAGVALACLHGALLLLDHTFAFSPASLLVPFRSPYAPLAVGVGQLSLYLAALVTASFYVRRRIGQRAWRLLHYTTFLAFVGAAAHGIAAGSDSGAPWAFWLYLVPLAIAVFLFGYRAVTGPAAAVARRRARPAAATPAIASTPGRGVVRPLPARPSDLALD